MAKTVKKQHEKIVQHKTCEKCNQIIKPVGFMRKGKMKSAKQCGCGVFIGNEKVD